MGILARIFGFRLGLEEFTMTKGKLIPITLELDAETSILTLQLAQFDFKKGLLRLLLLLMEASGCELAFRFLALLFEDL